MNISIKTIPYKDQRYRTPADWTIDAEGNINIFVSKMDDWRYIALCGVHELIEVLICRHQGVTQQMVDLFDMAFERNRVAGNTDEPGNSTEAPYRTAHFVAETVERILAVALGVNWSHYGMAVDAL